MIVEMKNLTKEAENQGNKISKKVKQKGKEMGNIEERSIISPEDKNSNNKAIKGDKFSKKNSEVYHIYTMK